MGKAFLLALAIYGWTAICFHYMPTLLASLNAVVLFVVVAIGYQIGRDGVWPLHGG